MPKRQWAVAASYIILSTAVLWRLQLYPSIVPGSDASGYVGYAQFFRSSGAVSGLGPIRTYGYPLILWLYSLIAGFASPSIALVAGIAQLAAYGAAVLWLASRVESAALARAVVIGLLLNPVLVPLVADVLTEGVSLILAVLALACLFNAARAERTALVLAWAAIGAAATNFALMVRPANLALVIAWNAGLALSLLVSRPEVRRVRVALGYSIAFVATAVMAWAPQYLDTGTILPAHPLFHGETMMGVRFMKYATIVNGAGEAQGFLFPNPWCVGPLPHESVWAWYVAHPWHGLATLAAHIFAAFNFDYPFVYVYDADPSYSPVLAGFMWFVAAVGVVNGILICKFQLRRDLAVTGMVATLFVVALGLNSLIMVESRFNMLPIAIVSVFAAHFAVSFRTVPPLIRAAVLIPALCVAVLGAIMSERMQATAFPFPTAGLAYACAP